MNDKKLFEGFRKIIENDLSKIIISYHIDSYNKFIQEGVQKIIDEIEFVPLEENFKILLWKIEFGSPILKEADGYERVITPMEAMIRNLNYTCPLYVNVIPIINDVHQDPTRIKLCDMPIMVRSILDPTRNMSREELIELGEDPYDPGGYFLVNGTEKIIVGVEEVANNKMIITKEKKKGIEMVRINSEKNQYIQRHMIERKDRILYMNFSNLRNVPLIVVLRALGLETDKQIMEAISDNPKLDEEILTNIYEYEDVKNKKDALNYLERFVRGMGKETPEERVQNLLNNFLLHHLGTTEKDQMTKAIYLAHVANRIIKVGLDIHRGDDIDHLANKRVRLTGYYLDILLRSLLLGKSGLASRIKYNYQRLTKRKKTPVLQALFESNYITKRIMSALATGQWVGGRVGITQRLDRINYIRRLSNMRAVVSVLSSSQEHPEARELHGTHWGKFCAQETPEGINIGLRKHLAVLASISRGLSDKEKIVNFVKERL
jgi:DNA-directed RNA polymerase subunit B